MGGLGSGRQWYYGAKDTTDDHRKLDVRRLHRDGLLKSNQTYSWQWSRNGEVTSSIQIRTESDQIVLKYRHRSGSEEWQDRHYPVELNWSDCAFGGQRPWFICPARGCGRRVALLYSGSIFACRHCHQLAYPSQREVGYDRATRKADRIRDRLGWEPGILNWSGGKPKGMHWKTFYRLKAEHDALVQQSLAGISAKLGIMGERFEDFL